MAHQLRRPIQRFVKSPFISSLPHRGVTSIPADADVSSGAPSPAVDAAYGFDVADLATARPMSEIPGRRRLPFIGTMHEFKPFPGAKVGLFDNRARGKYFEETYGQIKRGHIPWLPGCDTVITLLDPKDFNIVFRNEGKDYWHNRYKNNNNNSKNTSTVVTILTIFGEGGRFFKNGRRTSIL